MQQVLTTWRNRYGNHGRQDFSRRWRTFQSLCNRSFDDCFMIRDLKIIRGPKGHFVGMPSKRGKGGRYYEIISAITLEARKMLENSIFAEYEKLIGEPVTRRKLET